MYVLLNELLFSHFMSKADGLGLMVMTFITLGGVIWHVQLDGSTRLSENLEAQQPHENTTW